jgi:hypothetical protein
MGQQEEGRWPGRGMKGTAGGREVPGAGDDRGSKSEGGRQCKRTLYTFFMHTSHFF